ncbi:TKL protein kinase [Phytophthora palmivora]|uniref:TKL protein kinase n=1 Tax=Phytophthora palmivora TaxID=4796 RepID=A0A2P4X6K7_9STRA|nr:TKL protein kinase [Phytophthora palmivora]
MQDVIIGRVIGEGAFGKVYNASWKGRNVAVKVLIRQNLSADVVREFETEVKIMSFLHHPNICMLLGACLAPESRALVIELVEQGSLWAVLRTRRRQLTDEMRARFVLDTARGMSYLHHFELPILHRDMKSPNLLVEHDYSIKISDFGLSRVKAQIQTMTGNCGTVQWMAPEVLGNRKYTEKADVFSFGIVVWEIFTGMCPYDGMTQIQVALGVLNHDLRPPIPRSCPRFFARLIRSCWMREPSLRPSFSELVRTFEQYVAHQ